MPLSQFSWKTRSPLLLGNAHRLDAALLEAEGDHRVAHLLPDRVEVLLGLGDLGRIDRAVAGRHAVLRRALEDCQMAGLLGGGDDELSSGGTGTDHADPLAGDVQVAWPGVGVHEGAREAVAPGNVGHVGLREEPERRHQVAAGECLAGARAHLPELALLVEHRARHFSVQLDVAAQVEAVDDVVEVLLDLGLLQIARGPVPLLQQVLVEGVAVDETFGVGLRAGVAVEVPGAADAAALLERPDLEPQLVAELVKHVDATKPGTDDDSIEVNLRSRFPGKIVHGVLPCGTRGMVPLFMMLWDWSADRRCRRA